MVYVRMSFAVFFECCKVIEENRLVCRVELLPLEARGIPFVNSGVNLEACVSCGHKRVDVLTAVAARATMTGGTSSSSFPSLS